MKDKMGQKSSEWVSGSSVLASGTTHPKYTVRTSCVCPNPQESLHTVALVLKRSRGIRAQVAADMEALSETHPSLNVSYTNTLIIAR